MQHSGPVLVCGNAWCLPEDLEAARKIVSDAPVIAVNGAAREVKAIGLFSVHPQRFIEYGYDWLKHQTRLFGPVLVHAVREQPGMPWVNHWWPEIKGSGGGSVWCARKLAWLMGFDPVILCGAPLVAGSYAGFRPGRIMAQPEIMIPYRREIEHDVEWHKGAYSMSGWTRDFLGSPPGC